MVCDMLLIVKNNWNEMVLERKQVLMKLMSLNKVPNTQQYIHVDTHFDKDNSTTHNLSI